MVLPKVSCAWYVLKDSMRDDDQLGRTIHVAMIVRSKRTGKLYRAEEFHEPAHYWEMKTYGWTGRKITRAHEFMWEDFERVEDETADVRQPVRGNRGD